MILLDPDLPEALTPAAAPAIPRTHRLPSARTLAGFLKLAQAAVRLKGQVNVLFTTDTAIRRLNRQFRGKNKATDVLSFPAGGIGAEEIAGDLAISVPTALRQAIEQGHSLSTEAKVLMLHGLLHVAGYDHEADSGQMARRERLLRTRLRLPQGLIERVATLHPSARKLAIHSTKTRVLKGHGFSRAKKSLKNNAALAAEGSFFAENAIPQGLKPNIPAGCVMARLKSCPSKASKINRPALQISAAKTRKPRTSNARAGKS
jgi:probable rRNA maturation factor